jgi:hypothetical protein
MRFNLAEGERLDDRIVLGVLVAAMALGLVLYNVVSFGGGDDARAAQPAALSTPSTSAAPAPASVDSGSSTSPSLSSSGGSSFGSGSAALDAGATASDLVSSGSASPPVTTPRTPPVPAPTCTTEQASEAYESISDPIAAAIGESLPRDNLRLIAEIAAGCSAETPTTPVLGLALDIARLVPATGVPTVDLSAVPAVPAPPIPAAIIDALAPIQPQIMEACGNVGLMGIIVAVVPSTAGIPVAGSDLADVLVPAQTLCAQFE